MANSKFSKKISSARVWVICLLLSTPLSISASEDTLIKIESDRFDFYPHENKVKYEGSVITKYRDLTLESESLEGVLERSKNISRLVAHGDPVLIKHRSTNTRPTLHGTAGKIKVINDGDIIVLSNHATLKYGDSTISSSVIRLNIKTGGIKAGEVESRVLMTFQNQVLQ